MDFIKKTWMKFKNKNIQFEKSNEGLKIKNNSEAHGFLAHPYIINNDIKTLKIEFSGKVLKGNGAILQILDFKRNILCETSFNSQSYFIVNTKKVLFSIKMQRNSEVIIDKINIQFFKEEHSELEDIIKSPNDVLIITPSYPTEENKYFGGFVHSRVKAYKEAGLKFDLVCAHQYENICKYSFEGIDVTRTGFRGLREILTSKKYSKILLHFFDGNYAKVLDACDLSGTQLFLWVHGPETLYWDWSKMTDKYFEAKTELSEEQIEQFKENDKLINRYNNYDNVHWVFVSNWIKEKSEELINIKFRNFSVIPNFIDPDNFKFEKKDIELRKNIFFIRRFEDISKYAIDVNVRTILELSRRDFFKDLQINIYGTGDHYETLIEPIKNFKNVHLYPEFLNHEEIAKVHKENGIGLFATRYDAQGVSMCEAAMSGLAIVSSQNDAIKEFIPEEDGILADTENYMEYANIIEKIYKEPALFTKLSEDCHNKVYEKCNYDETIQKEIDMIKNEKYVQKKFEPKTENKVLSIIIPSYNVQKYLFHGVYTMLNHKNANKIQIIIVNDGSKDNTINVAKKLQDTFSEQNITIVDKPNGGHGSTINAGIKVAKGKYVRIIDGDDWVDSNEMEKLVDTLEKTETDIVITNYCEDRAETNQLIKKHIYDFMVPGETYYFDDLCYEGYGFGEWGPILATSNFKTEILKNNMPKLTEKCFYIDMEFNAYSIANAQTISFYPMYVYKYFIGREGQSISKESYSKNFKQHEKVLFNLIKFYTEANISENKKKYILNKLILPMITAHYTVLIQFLKSPKEFRKFESKLKVYDAIYNNSKIATRMKKFHRKTRGRFIKCDNSIKRLKNKIFTR